MGMKFLCEPTQSEHREEQQPEHAENGRQHHLTDGGRMDSLAELCRYIGVVDIIPIYHVLQHKVKQPCKMNRAGVNIK